MAFVKPEYNQIAPVKIMLSVGCLFDIPTGTYLDGIHGEKILNGGIGALNGIVGVGNCFKSTITHYQSLTAAYRAHGQSSIITYDTESNIHPWHLSELSVYATGDDWIAQERWSVTDRSLYEGDAWYDIFKDFMKAKKGDKSLLVDTKYRDRNGKPLKTIIPTLAEVDSFSKFSTSDVVKMQDDNKLGEKGANTMHMRQGLQKSRFLDETPSYATGSSTYIMLTAHFGEKIEMDPYAPTLKKLQYVKQGQAIKGVPSNFTFFMNTCWQALSAKPLVDGDRAPLYPRSSDDRTSKDTDLNEVDLLQLRCKSGPSGNEIKIIVSQTEGVLPSLSEFHYLKTNKRFGLPGNDREYQCALLPGVTLTRTNIRNNLSANKRLARAINICSELLQMIKMWYPKKKLEERLVCTPEELYTGIQAQGYDWEMILGMTRGYTSFDPEHPLLELSTMDLLRMRIGEYHPYWLEDDKKTIKKAYLGCVKELIAANQPLLGKSAADVKVGAELAIKGKASKTVKDSPIVKDDIDAQLEAELKKSLA